MTLGQRIREARLDRRLTQQELVGEYITRNMLSKIENDSATPSVRTLEYLAERLGLSPGEFLSSDAPQTADCISELEKLMATDPEEFARRLSDEKRRMLSMEQRLRLLEAEACLDNGGLDEAERLLDMDAPGDADVFYRYMLLKGKLCLEKGQLEQAKLTLTEAEKSAPPRTDLKRLYRLLEGCCHSLGDYENAYLYATRQREGQL